ncbi:hypothetical protein CC78DRAFT_25725 [Lojkania enalia]|uniref:Uncharacterized protein n=1 Tax=Lojkania enalia TaxID=147567 RepID=A0A9P4K321_9PLEO|nr:hypothetical protein CC78DRAFT_25725 [Didymosphaeria enalia]
MSALAHITILLSLLGFTITLDSNASCYYPNGDTNENVYPCTRFVVNGEASCCWKNDICTSTGFCMSSTIGLFYRGLCTKRDWDTNACPNYCMQDEWRGQTIAVMACNDTVFACGYASDAGNTCDGGDSSATFAVTSRNSMTQYQVLPGSPSTPENVTIYAADDATVSSSMSGPLCEASATAPSERGKLKCAWP